MNFIENCIYEIVISCDNKTPKSFICCIRMKLDPLILYSNFKFKFRHKKEICEHFSGFILLRPLVEQVPQKY